MRLTDNNNVSNGITDRNFVYMEYIGLVEVQRFGGFTMISNKFELTTPFFGKDSEEIARRSGNIHYLHIREDDFHPMGYVKYTLYNIQSVKCVGEKIKLELLTQRSNLSKDDLRNEADKISNTRFRFVLQDFVDGISYDLIMIHVKD